MENRWIANIFGVVNFWYYDIEEFPLSDGKLLLRGSNGSGKSVTMQSFIPLLLDGNKAPERIDPFGTKSRRMENYLLDEKTDEKTAYLYIEFKRKNTENYITIGMGMKAIRNKALDSWYFIITDGRRVNKDLYLYKDAGALIPLTKQELQNRIGEGGLYFDSQKKYMEKVNEYLFGYDDLEKYEELLNLLIQLRSPKLSRDFKPTEIYKILTESLRILSDEDLRPMSESMENMDGLRNSLDESKRGLKSAENIKYHYDKYNKSCLFVKGEELQKKHKEVQKLEQGLSELRKELDDKESALENSKVELDIFRTALKEAEIKHESLRENDIFKSKESLNKVAKELLEIKEGILSKEKQLESKKSNEREKESRLKQEKDYLESIKYKTEDILKDLEDIGEEFNFEDGVNLKDDFLKDMENYQLDFVKISLDKYLYKINAGIRALKDYEEAKKEYDKHLEEKERLQSHKGLLEEQLKKKEELLLEGKEELKVAYVRWNKENEFLKLQDKEIRSMSTKIDTIDNMFNLVDINNIVNITFQEERNKLKYEIDYRNRLFKEKQQYIKDIQKEIEELKISKEIQPKRTQGVIKNRERLTSIGIPFVPLYKAIDFLKDVSEEVEKSFEAALEDMGLLDALIVDEKHKNEALRFGEGQWDRYIFTEGNIMKYNISTYFGVEKEELNGVSFEAVDNVLQGIFLEEDYLASIDEQGNYGLGALKGKANRDYVLKYIGINSRKKHRERLINEKLKEIEDVENDIKHLNLEVEEFNNKVKTIDLEKQKEPSSKDLRTALSLIEENVKDLKTVDDKCMKEEELLFSTGEQLKKEKKRLLDTTEELNIVKELKVFEDAKEAGEDYKNRISDLIIIQKDIKNYVKYIESLNNSLDEIRIDIDNLYYEINSLNKKYGDKNSEANSYREVLSKSDITEIEEEMEKCIEVKNAYPEKIERDIRYISATENNIEYIRNNIGDNESSLNSEKKLLEVLKEIFLQEYSLNYISKVEEREALTIYRKLRDLLDLEDNKIKDDYFKAMMESINKNSADLREYSLKTVNVFSKDVYEDGFRNYYKKAERFDIKCRLEGKETSFNNLIDNLKKHIETLNLLISSEERRIFEEVLINTISTKIRSKIYLSKTWVDRINQLMESMNTSSSLALSLKWVPKKAENEEQMNVSQLLEILERGNGATDEDIGKLAEHFGNKVKEAIRNYEETGEVRNYHTIIKEVLDYRKWYEFKLYFTKKGENRKELTNNAFFQFSGGEKAMAMYIPLFSAVFARYENARKDCPRVICMDEAFAGVDENNIRDMFRLLKELNLDYVINSQILWGDYDTVDDLSICELIREENDDVVTVIRYHWNGIEKKCLV